MIANLKTPRDRGMTLIELLITLTIIGTLAGAMALIITTVLRLSPTQEGRVDDANALLTLTAFMPEDVNSTPMGTNPPGNPAGGFEFDKGLSSGCSITNPGVNLVRMTWNEVTTTTQIFIAAYRYENAGDGYRIMRYTCVATQAPRIAAMSDVLPLIDETTWSPGDAPVAVTEHVEAGLTTGLTFKVDTLNGDRFTVEMRTNDLDEELPSVPPWNAALTPSGNQPPVAGDVTVTIPKGVPMNVGIPASDPDGDGLTLTRMNGPTGGGWIYSISGLTMQITPGGFPGDYHEIQYRVMDPWGEVAFGLIKLTVGVPPPNSPPTAAAVNDTVVVGTSLVIYLPVSDPDGHPLSVTTSAPDPSLTVTITGTQLTVTSDGTAPGPLSFTYTVNDGFGGTATANVNLAITTSTCSVSSLTPTSTSVQLKNNGYLKNTVTFTVAYTGSCNDLVLAYDNNLADGYQPIYLAFGAGTSVTHQGNAGGLKWTLGNHTMTLQRGQAGSAILTAQMNVV